MGNRAEAGQGLKKMFIAMIGSIVFMVISIVGLNQAGKEIEGCKTAFILTIVTLIVSIVGAFFKTGILSTLFSIANSVLSLMVAYYVCTSVAAVMNQISAAEILYMIFLNKSYHALGVQ